MELLAAGRRYASTIVGHSTFVIAAILAATLIFCRGLSRLEIEVDPDRQLPQSHPYVAAFHDIRRIFGDNNFLTIGIRPTQGDILDPPFLALVREATERIGALPGANPTLLYSIASPATRYIQHTDAGLLVEPLLTRLPDSEKEIEALRSRLLSDPRFIGSIVSYDGSTLAIHASFDLTPALPGYVNIYESVTSILQETTKGRAEVLLSGPIVVVAALNIYASQVTYFFPLALLLIGIVHYDAFRTWQAVALPILTGTLAVSWALGLMGLLKIPLDPFNSTTPVLILAVAAGHAVQILKRYYEEYSRTGDNRVAVIESTARIAPVTLAASLIASLSFMSLATLGTASMRVFGIFTAFGILATITIEMTLIPAIRSVWPPPKSHQVTAEDRVHPKLDRNLRRLASKLSSRPFAQRTIVAYVTILTAAGIASRYIIIDSSFKRNFGVDDPVRKHDDRLNQLLAGTNFILLTVEGRSENAIADPAAINAIRDIQDQILQLNGVGKTLSVVDTLQTLHRAIDPTAPANALPGTRDLISQYLFLYTLSGGNDLSTQLTADNRLAKIVVFVRDDSTSRGEALISSIRDIAEQALPPGYSLRVAGTLASNSALTETMVRGKLLNILQIGAITIIVASVVFRSVAAGLLVSVPLAIAVMVNFGAMGLLGVTLDITTAPISAMAVGIGADYAVYFLFRIREECGKDGDYTAALSRCYSTSGKAILFVSSAVGIGYSVLCLSRFRLFEQLGGLVGLSMATSSMATLLVLPAILTLIQNTDPGRSILGLRNARDSDRRDVSAILKAG